MPQAPKHTRRWFRFSVGTMLLLVTAVAIVLAYHVNWIRQRREYIAKETARGESHGLLNESIQGENGSYLLRLFGDRGYSRVDVFVDARGLDELMQSEEHERVLEAARLFPEATIHDRNVDDGSLVGMTR